MKIIVACHSFKGSITSTEANEAIAQGIQQVLPHTEVKLIPIADGGEGTCDAFIQSIGGEKITITVHDPFMRSIEATYGILPDQTVVIEMAQAAGLTLLNHEERNPLKTTTYGVGEMIFDAVKRGYRKFIIGLGGSSTNDAGLGLLQALGFIFYDSHGKELPGNGESLSNIQTIDDRNVIPELKECSFQVMCDVTNPLYGPVGASFVFAPQKGADHKMVKILDNGLRHFNQLVHETYGINLQEINGSGAAGGLGGALYAFLNAQLQPGIELLFEKINIEDIIQEADLIITGEGRIDQQSAMGKVLSGFGTLGKINDIPIVALCGSYTLPLTSLYQIGITAIFSILNEPMTLEDAMAKDKTVERLTHTTVNVIQTFISNRN